MQKSRFKISATTILKIKKIVRWSVVVTKLAAIGTALTGAVTAVTSSMSTGFAITAAGATTYAAAKNIPGQGYDKTKHIPPVAVSKLSGGTTRQERLLLTKLQQKTMKSAVGSSLPSSSKSQVTALRSSSNSMMIRKRS